MPRGRLTHACAGPAPVHSEGLADRSVAGCAGRCHTPPLTGPGGSASVLARAVRILETLTPDTPALTVSEVARRSGLHVATASRLVGALVDLGLLARRPDRRVAVGVRLWELALQASPALGLREAAMPFLEDVHAVLGHSVQLGVLDGAEVVFVERLTAPGAVVNVAPDRRAIAAARLVLRRRPPGARRTGPAGGGPGRSARGVRGAHGDPPRPAARPARRGAPRGGRGAAGALHEQAAGSPCPSATRPAPSLLRCRVIARPTCTTSCGPAHRSVSAGRATTSVP